MIPLHSVQVLYPPEYVEMNVATSRIWVGVSTFPNPTIVGPDQINEDETPRVAWSHPLHDRPANAGFWLQDPLALDALFKPLTDSPVRSAMPVYMRDIGIEIPSGHLVTGHIIATDPHGHALLPKSTSAAADASCFAQGEVVIYRVIRGTAEFKKRAGETFELSAGDVVTAGKESISLVGVGENTQVLRLGLLKGMNDLRGWTPTQRDEKFSQATKRRLCRARSRRPCRA